MGLKVIDNTKRFIDKANDAAEKALIHMTGDIATLTSVWIPRDEGDLEASIDEISLEKYHKRVEVDSEYAAYQERGERYDGTHVVENYTTPGTGKGFLKRAGIFISKKGNQYFKKYGSLVRI